MPLSLARSILLLCFVVVSIPDPADADESTAGRVTGVLVDRSGAIVQAAVVELRGLDSAHRVSTVTQADGRYAFADVPPGDYQVIASVPGFEPVTRQASVGPQAHVVSDITLDVAQPLVHVEVTAPLGPRPLWIETDPRRPKQPIPAQDGADYLKTIPGFSVIRKGGTDGDPVLRGMAGSRLGILLDGENILGGCGNRMDPPTAYVFPEAYDRITILKGPQTVLHGPGNSAGVVLFERDRDVATGLRVFASPTVGLFGRNDQAAELRATGNRLYGRVSATRSAMDDYDDGDGRPVHAGYERWSTNAALGWTPDPSTRLEVSGALSDGEAAYADRAMDGVAFLRRNVGLRVERRTLAPWLQNLEAQVFYNYVDHVMDNYSLRTFTPSMMMPNRSVSNPDRRTIGGKVVAALQLTPTITATIGADYQDNRHTVRSSSNETLTPYAGLDRRLDAEFSNLGVYGELSAVFATGGRLVGGARLDRWSGRDARTVVSLGMSTTAANPTSGLERRETLPGGFARYEHQVGTHTTLFAGVGHARRAPDYWELMSKEGTASLSAFTARPEQTTQIDTGLQYRQGTLSGSFSVFANAIDDFILVQSNWAKPTTSPSTGMGGMTGMGTGMTTPSTRLTTVSRNVAASTWGGEASLAWSATSRLKLDGSLAYVRGDNDTDHRPLAQLPPLEGRLGLQFAVTRWFVGALARLVAAQDRYALNQGNIVGQDLGPTSAFAVLSLNGGWRLNGLMRISAGIDNLLDTTYAEFISRSGANVPGFTTTLRINEPGRLAWVKVDVRR